MKGLEGKVAIVTGSARGIGKAIATALASYKVKVVIADILEELAIETSKELNDLGLETSVYKVDLRQIEEINKLVDFTVKTYGTVDILVNCAAIQIRKASANFEEDDWDFINDVNLKAPFFLSQAAGKIMLEKGKGSIVCISSGTAIRYTSRRVPYNVTKAAVNALAGALGNEWARFGVRVNAVAPGWNATEMVKDGLKMGIIKEDEILPMVPVNRFMDPKEVANTVCFLASDEASGIVGQTIYVDGGGSLRCIPETNDFAYDQND
ncbi:SDR family oxidoreductase [Vallitalea pronyensis]|uniref:SDR family oxidoreductase n=1 Tax=Vallitalea pronyensis TaxID=1348613 RepID=A0A8J8SIF2_9FIRM|nr:SDR family oxidoreductase [Vallitalea pronyensis]QUI24521.1 SDR family oxidoreductase [Vallitalea pronyensis]